ncbi:hypothetical protein Scep_015027 [Stephania cephalantha]|uniref:Uncharacterized protein n=1 Tax=Stephania cephalantha TaxID=152367 RepID=A0AAP0J4Z5_9MAGN
MTRPALQRKNEGLLVLALSSGLDDMVASCILHPRLRHDVKPLPSSGGDFLLSRACVALASLRNT